MARALRAINDIEFLERELDASSQFLDAGAQFTVLHWSQFVEQGLNKSRVHSDDKQLEKDAMCVINNMSTHKNK
jgi:hypothetical protein